MTEAQNVPIDDYTWRHSVAILRSLIALLMLREEKRSDVRRIVEEAMRESVDRSARKD